MNTDNPNKLSRREIAITAVVPGAVFLAILVFAYMAMRPVKNTPKTLALPGMAPHETIQTSNQIPSAKEVPTPGAETSAPSKSHLGEPTQPTPENPVTALPQDDDQAQQDSQDNSSPTDNQDDNNPPQGDGTSN